MKEVIGRVKDIIVHMANPQRIILFGSIAQGLQNVHSDIDVLIVTPAKLLNNYELAGQVRQRIGEMAFPADVLVIDEAGYRKAVKERSFIGTIVRHGIIIYEKK